MRIHTINIFFFVLFFQERHGLACGMDKYNLVMEKIQSFLLICGCIGKLSVRLANKNYYLKRRQKINKTLVDFSKNQATLG